MLLISAPPSPFARKVRIALLEKGVPFELRNEMPWQDDTRTPLYNPLEQLPILIPDGGEPLFESGFILDWIESSFPDPPLVPAATPDRFAVKRVQVVAEGVMNALVLLFWEARREQPSLDWSSRQLRKIGGGLRDLEGRLDGRDHFVADRFTLADVAAVSMLGVLDVAEGQGIVEVWRAIDPGWASWRDRHPGLVRYAAALASRPSVRATEPFMFEVKQAVA